jgi:hypothetical protein
MTTGRDSIVVKQVKVLWYGVIVGACVYIALFAGCRWHGDDASPPEAGKSSATGTAIDRHPLRKGRTTREVLLRINDYSETDAWAEHKATDWQLVQWVLDKNFQAGMKLVDRRIWTVRSSEDAKSFAKYIVERGSLPSEDCGRAAETLARARHYEVLPARARTAPEINHLIWNAYSVCMESAQSDEIKQTVLLASQGSEMMVGGFPADIVLSVDEVRKLTGSEVERVFYKMCRVLRGDTTGSRCR